MALLSTKFNSGFFPTIRESYHSLIDYIKGNIPILNRDTLVSNANVGMTCINSEFGIESPNVDLTARLNIDSSASFKSYDLFSLPEAFQQTINHLESDVNTQLRRLEQNQELLDDLVEKALDARTEQDFYSPINDIIHLGIKPTLTIPDSWINS